MKKNRLLLLLSICIVTCQAQTINIKEGDTRKKVFFGTEFYRDYFYGFENGKKHTLIIHKYDKNLDPISEVADSIFYENRPAYINSPLFEINNSIYGHFTTYDATKKPVHSFLTKLGEKGKFIDPPALLVKGTVSVSPNGKTIAYFAHTDAGSANNSFQLNVFDSTLTLNSDRSKTIRTNENQFRVFRFNVNNDGDVAILTKFIEKDEKKQEHTTYKLFSVVEGTLEEIILPLQSNTEITDLFMKFSPTGELILTGVYASKDDKDLKTTGIFIANYNCKTGRNLSVNNIPFTQEETDIIEKNNRYTLKIEGLNFFDNGLPILFLQFKAHVDVTDRGGSLNIDYFGDKIILTFDKNLQLTLNKMVIGKFGADIEFGPGSWFNKMGNNTLLLYRLNDYKLRALFINDHGEVNDKGTVFKYGEKGNIKTVSKLDESTILLRLSNPGYTLKEKLNPIEKLVWLTITP